MGQDITHGGLHILCIDINYLFIFTFCTYNTLFLWLISVFCWRDQFRIIMTNTVIVTSFRNVNISVSFL